VQNLKRYIPYVLGFGVAAACLIVGVIGIIHGNPAHSWLPILIFGVALLVAMILIAQWDKASDVSSFKLDGSQSAIAGGIVFAGLVAAIVAALVT
jgi:hypothetical protein